MREAIRIAMLDAAAQRRLDVGSAVEPELAAQRPVRVRAQARGPVDVHLGRQWPAGKYDNPKKAIDYYNARTRWAWRRCRWVNTRAFQLKLASLKIPATYSFPSNGTHAWGYWSEELWKAAARS